MTFFALARKFWWLPVILAMAFYIACLRLTVAHQETSITRYGGVMALSVERIRTARATALANDLANARAKEAQYAKATQETENALLPALDRARADAARYVGMLRAQAAGGGSSVPHLPYAANPSTVADAAGDPTELDVLACADAVIKAEGWQTFWNKTFGGVK